MYRGHVTVTGRVIDIRVTVAGTAPKQYRIQVDEVGGDGEWPYPPSKGDRPWVLEQNIVHQHSRA